MKKAYYGVIYTDTSNADKVRAIKSVAKNITVKSVELDPPVDVIPLTRNDTRHFANERVFRLHREKKVSGICIGIQKGVTINSTDEDCALILAVSVMRTFSQKPLCTFSSSILLPSEIRDLIQKKNYKLYDAYEEVFGSPIKNKEASLYSLLTNKDESVWLMETIENGLAPFLKNYNFYKWL